MFSMMELYSYVGVERHTAMDSETRTHRCATDVPQGHFGVVSQDWSHFALSGGPVTAMVLRNDKLEKLPVALPYPTAADWSPDNSLLAINGERRGVYRISDGGLAWQFGKNDSSEKFSRFSPNGKWAISTEYHREDSVQPERYIYYLRRARDGKLVRELPVQADHFSQPIFSPTSEAFALFGNGDLRFYRLTDGLCCVRWQE
jgi:hypothetical protein